MKKCLIIMLLIACACLWHTGSVQADPIRVVTTLSTFADLVSTIGKEHVQVSYIASPKFNPHFINPKPSDILKMKRADLFVHGGLDLEIWRFTLLDAVGKSEFKAGGAKQVDLSQGIHLMEIPMHAQTRAEGDIHLYGNPHYWIDPRNAKIMAKAICKKLSQFDPLHSDIYDQNLRSFVSKLDEKIREWTMRCEKFRGQTFVAYHNEWLYLIDFAGFNIEEYLEPKPGVPPTPKRLQFLEAYIDQNNVSAIIVATFMPKNASKNLAKRTGAKLALLCQNVGELDEANDYISMIDYNISQLISSSGD